MIVLLFGWVATAAIVLFFPSIFWTEHIEEMQRGVLAAFTGELLFFTLIGGAVTIVSLRDPTEERFDDRLKILYGRGAVPNAVLQYNKNVITKISAYSKTIKRVIIIEAYDNTLKAYRERITTEYEISNLLPDVPYGESMRLSVIPDDFGQADPSELGRIISIQVGGSQTITKPIPIGKDGISTEVKIELPPGGSKTVIWEYRLWIKTEAIQAVQPEWVVEQLAMDIVSECDGGAQLEIDSDPRGVVSLLHMQPLQFQRLTGVSPGEKVYVHKLLPPLVEDPALGIT
jgi:hypothetical protein